MFFKLYSAELTPEEKEIINNWNVFFQENSNGKYIQFTERDGVVVVKNALQHISQEKRDRIWVIAIAPTERIPWSLCGYVAYYVEITNYAHNIRDPFYRNWLVFEFNNIVDIVQSK